MGCKPGGWGTGRVGGRGKNEGGGSKRVLSGRNSGGAGGRQSSIFRNRKKG